MNLKEVIEKYSENPSKITIRTFDEPADEPGDMPETYVLIEGESEALRFLGEAILGFVNSNSGCNWDIHPNGAGNIYFSADSTAGVYLHKIPCDLHPDNKVK
jgi:hypothetical protein